MSSPLTLSSEQILWFRARRSHLAGGGAASLTEAASDLLGAQAQQLAPSLHALALRTAGRPRATQVLAELLEEPRGLLRTWGPRETVHLYDPADWCAVVSARAQWSRKGRQGVLPGDEELDEALAVVREMEEPVSRRSLTGTARPELVEGLREIAGMARQEPEYFAAGRLVFCLAMRGDLCTGPTEGSTQLYPLRERWFPDLPWAPMDSQAANVALLRRYLSVFGPATDHDIAHYFGGKVTLARTWVADLKSELVPVRCEDRVMHGLAVDVDAMREPVGDWPTRLLPRYDTMMMAWADKRWTVPVEAERKEVWRKAARVAATVIHRGEAVATWTHKATKKLCKVTVTPLSGWSKELLPAVREEAQQLAEHMGVPEAVVL